ncbi:MAG: PKD domain-containing protein [Flavobacteriales bacterium]|nr:PKD domain-containing protein [Flavobacteriales bacterium]
MKSLLLNWPTGLLALTSAILSISQSYSQCAVNAGPDATKCQGQPYNPGPNVTTSGTTGTVTYSWNGTTFNPTPNTSLAPTTTTTYTLTIQDANGCIATDNITITVLSLPTVNAGLDMTICSGVPTQLCANATSPNGAITLYTWVGGPPTQCWTVAPTSPSTYNVTAVDAAGCQKSDAIAISIYPLPTVNAGSDQSMCLSQGSIQLTATPAGGTWSGTGVNASGLFTPSTTGNFTLTYSYTNSNGCTNTDQAVVTVTTPSPINGGPDQDVCLNSGNIQLPSVGTWSGSPLVTSGGLFTPSAVGTYNLTVTSGSPGCNVSDNVTMEVRPLPTVTAGADVSICNGQTASLNGTASSTNGNITVIDWNGSSLGTDGILNTTATPSSTTNYTLTVTDEENCSASDVMTVIVNNYPTVQAGNDVTLCSNSGAYSLPGFSPAGGTWTGTGVNSAGVFTPTVTGSFILTYTYSNASGCTSTDQLTVTVVPPGTVNAGNDVSLCLNSGAHQLQTGGTWSGSTWVTSGGSFNPGQTGVFNLTYTASTGTCMASDQLVVTVLSLPSVNAGTNQDICTGSTAQLNAIASSTNGAINAYSWTGSVSQNNISNPTATPAITSSYTVTATDAAGCSASDDVTVNVHALPNVNAGFNLTTCINGGPVALAGFTPAGGLWSGTDVDASGVFSPSTTGTFTLTYTYTDSYSCTASDQMDISVINPGPLNAGPDLQVCLNSPAVQLATGGTWSGSPWVTSGGLFTPSATGTYNLTYQAMSGGCLATDQIVVVVLGLPTVNAGSDVSACTGSVVSFNAVANTPNGSITDYDWSGGTVSNPSIANPTHTVNANLTLSVMVTDASGCTATDALNIVANPIPTVNAGLDQTFCDQGIAQTLTGFSPSGGVWSGTDVSSSGVFTPSTLGAHVLTYSYTNAFGCTSSDSNTITVIATTYADAGADSDLCEGSATVNLTPGVSGGSWSGSAYVNSSGAFTPTQNGSFTVTYTLGSGSCLTTDNRIVNVHDIPVVNAGNDAGVCEGSPYQLSGGVSSSSPSVNYSWDHAQYLDDPNIGFATATVPSTTVFTLTATDNYGCTASDAMTLSVEAMPFADFTHPATGCLNNIVNFTNNSTGATEYEWSFGNGSNSMMEDGHTIYSIGGTYQVTLLAYNSLGCSHSYSDDIEIISAPQASFNTSVQSGCTPLSVSFDNTTAGTGVSYSWSMDGNSYNVQDPNPYAFAASDVNTIHEIILTATNTCGSNSHSEMVEVYPTPHASFSTNLSSQCSPVTTVFSNNTTGNPDSYLWDFGDGETTSDAVPSPRVYITEESSEDFIIKLFAYNACGSDMAESVVTVLPNTVHIDLVPSAPIGCSPMFVEFQNNTTGATNYAFEFGDSSTSTLMSPNHIYDEAGEYDVIYYANDGCSFDTTTFTITVLPSPEITVTAEESSICPLNDAHFHATTTGNIQNISWDYGDGHYDTGLDVSHPFEVGNTYMVSATATENNGCQATDNITFIVHPQPVSVMNLSATDGCSPLHVCSQNASQNASIYSWTFSNGFTSSDMDVCQDFVNTTGSPQDIQVSLDTENEFGCEGHATETIHVLPQPTTTFTLDQVESCFLSEDVNVNVITSGSGAYQWFADGVAFSNASTPTFNFDEVGDHSIVVISSNVFECTDQHEEIYTIHPTPSIDIMPSVFNGCAPLVVEFENSTTDGVTWNWTFGNGASSAEQNPSVTIQNPGLYDVQLHAVSEFGCEKTQHFDDMLEVFEVPVASFTFDPDADIIYEVDIQFTDASVGATQYMWDFGDGYTAEEASPLHHYNRGGAFDVTLKVMNDYGCLSEYSRLVNIDNTFYIFVPNSFTPDGDGVNDVFMPVISSKEEIRSYRFDVINRWGEVVFTTDDPDMPWTGNVRGGEYFTHNDMFTFQIEVSFNNLQVDKRISGSVTVLR